MDWTLGDDGRLRVLKNAGGETGFKIRLDPHHSFSLQEPDGQNIAIIRPHDVDPNIKDVETISSQRRVEHVHELVLYTSILIRSVNF